MAGIGRDPLISHGGKIRKLAAEAGILDGDPMGPFVDAVAEAADEITEVPTEIEVRLSPILTRLEAAVGSLEKSASAEPQSAVSDNQVDAVAHRLMVGCQAWSRQFLWASWLRSGVLAATTLLVVLGVGISVGWVLHAPAQGMVCADQADGSRICWLYQKLSNRH